jgi:uncharacterized protein (DUF2267 family)
MQFGAAAPRPAKERHMPMPYEYLHAGETFDRFLDEARDALGHTTRHQTYTTVQAVLLAFRRRLTVEDGLRFANALPTVLRAIFVADWDTHTPPVAFSSRAAMSEEVRALRKAHNFSPPSAIADIARTLRNHVDVQAFDAVLASLPPGAVEFWRVEEDR